MRSVHWKNKSFSTKSYQDPGIYMWMDRRRGHTKDIFPLLIFSMLSTNCCTSGLMILTISSSLSELRRTCQQFHFTLQRRSHWSRFLIPRKLITNRFYKLTRWWQRSNILQLLFICHWRAAIASIMRHRDVDFATKSRQKYSNAKTTTTLFIDTFSLALHTSSVLLLQSPLCVFKTSFEAAFTLSCWLRWLLIRSRDDR